MCLINKLPHPLYFLCVSFIACCLSITLLVNGVFDEPVTYHYFHWSPNGDKLAISFVIDDGTSEIFLVDADGQNLKYVLTANSTNIWSEWSEDGKILYYSFDNISGRYESGTWYQIDVEQINIGVPDMILTVEDYQVVPFEDVETNAWAGTYDRFYSTPLANSGDIAPSATSDTHYAISVCETNTSLCWDFDMWYQAEIYSIATNELLWTIRRNEYKLARFGIRESNPLITSLITVNFLD